MSAPAGRSTRRVVVVVILLLGALALVASVQTWLTAAGTSVLLSGTRVSATGAKAAPVVSAAALVVVAGALALALTKKVGRWIVLAVVFGSGVAICASSLAVVLDPRAAAAAAALEKTGVAEISGTVQLTWAGWAAAALGALIVVAATWGALVSRGWTWRDRRHGSDPRPTGSEGSNESRSPAQDDLDDLDDREVWDDLSAGNDPTA